MGSDEALRNNYEFKDCPAVLESFLRYCRLVKNASAKTLEARYTDIYPFLRYLRRLYENIPQEVPVTLADMDISLVASATEDDVADYMEELGADGKLASSSLYRKASSLKTFYNYLIQNQDELGIHISKNPVGRQPWEGSLQPVRALSAAEVSKLLKSVQGEAAVRDTAIILLICTTAVSMGELVKIRCKDYQDDAMQVAGRKVYLTEPCRKALDTYLREYRDPAEEWIYDNALFVSQNYRRRLTPRGVQKALQKHFDRAGIDGTARDLRHTAVLQMLLSARNECERSYIAGCLGYSNYKTIKGFNLPDFDQVDTVKAAENTWLGKIGQFGPDE